VIHRSTVDPQTELARVWARRRSRARGLAVAAWGARGEDGDPNPGWREWVEGLGRRASAKGGGGGANSTTRGLGREGGERGANLSAVKMVGGVALFYRV
jgi:hypothetical protein